MLFNQRTSLLIIKYSSQFNVSPFYIRILRAVYRHAWIVLSYPFSGPHNYLAHSRQFRNRLWWEGLKHRCSANGYSRRKKKEFSCMRLREHAHTGGLYSATFWGSTGGRNEMAPVRKRTGCSNSGSLRLMLARSTACPT